MGIECYISCPSENLAELKAFLRDAGGQPCLQFPEQLEFRFRSSALEEMPDATAVVQSDGLYFCDNCGAREPVALLFRRIIDKMLTLSESTDSIVITSL